VLTHALVLDKLRRFSMRVHAAQLSLLEVDDPPPKGNASKRPTQPDRQTATRPVKPAETAKRPRRDARAKSRSSTPLVPGVGLLTTEEAAALLHVHPRTVQRLVERGDLSAVHLGGAVRFDPVDVQGLIEQVKRRVAHPAQRDTVRPRSRKPRATVSSGSFRDRIGSNRS
jgi:excisionase family DNA binding protein